MEQFFVLILVFLIVLAMFDLFVGVSNDAVNFLTSAIGSQAASFRTVMLVASVGVLVGATFSSGMMEIARTGVFNPEMFTFAEIIIIFFAIAISDVLLLDIFNSLGLPTSTTVSIVFELLGGAVGTAIYKIKNDPLAAAQVSEYINNEKALAIVSGILISVVVAFTAGTIIQLITRLIFTFKYGAIYRYIGSVFGGLALTAIIYFLVVKGAKNSSFMRPEYVEWIGLHTLSILLYTFLAFTAIFQLLISLFNVNIFRIVILLGTFALAFAFAGNDLVNFIGVTLAAFSSYSAYAASHLAADAFTMESLRESVQTPTLVLLLAGGIMVLTLWTSKKARRVVQTSINLSSGSRGAKEQFGSSLLGRSLVRGVLSFDKVMHQLLPASFFGFMDRRMEKPVHKKGEVVLPFDQVRASINLVVSSILIASATSLKLPLSTTYVTFMVAMGSSFADGAWDRESAVYRISGVLTVIGGWFLTALSAFTLCLGIATLALWGGNVAVVLLMLGVTALLLKLNFFAKKKKVEQTFAPIKADKFAICKAVNVAVEHYFSSILTLYKEGLEHFESEDLRAMRRDKSAAANLHDAITKARGAYYEMAMEGGEDRLDQDARLYYYRVLTSLKELSHGLRGVVGTACNHIDNNHRVFAGEMKSNLEKMMQDLHSLAPFLLRYVHLAADDETLTHRIADSTMLINGIQSQTIAQIDSENLSLRNTELYLNFLQFSRDVVNRFALISLLQHELNQKCGEEAQL
ncbi:MAG: inorganic phosphate transporter [Prevotellaceae bacterium]|nr:inorganic phosphate transporter [Prevotellaceae bacterium]